jgi:hypothetical protein
MRRGGHYACGKQGSPLPRLSYGRRRIRNMKRMKTIAIGALLVGALGLAGCFAGAPGYYGGYGSPAYGYSSYPEIGYSSYPAWGYNSYPAIGYGAWAPYYHNHGWGEDGWGHRGHDGWAIGGHPHNFAGGGFYNGAFNIARNHGFAGGFGGGRLGGGNFGGGHFGGGHLGGGSGGFYGGGSSHGGRHR